MDNFWSGIYETLSPEEKLNVPTSSELQEEMDRLYFEGYMAYEDNNDELYEEICSKFCAVNDRLIQLYGKLSSIVWHQWK